MEHPGGIAPDVEIEPSEQDFIASNDVQLKKAIEFLKAQIAQRAGQNAAKLPK